MISPSPRGWGRGLEEGWEGWGGWGGWGESSSFLKKGISTALSNCDEIPTRLASLKNGAGSGSYARSTTSGAFGTLLAIQFPRQF